MTRKSKPQTQSVQKKKTSTSESPSLLSLPDDLWIDVIQDWLVYKDLCGLDTAVCVHGGVRDGFLKLLSSDRKTMLDYNGRVPPPPRRFFRWIAARGIKLHSLVIYQDCDEEDWATLRALALDTSCINRLQILRVEWGASYNDADMSNVLVQCCKTLKHLNCSWSFNVHSFTNHIVPYIARSVLVLNVTF